MTYSKFRWDEDCPIEIIEEKHLSGKHDQATHGRGGGKQASAAIDDEADQEFRSQAVAQLGAWEEANFQLPKEHLYGIARDGRILTKTSGRDDAVEIDDQLAKDLEGGAFTHNHPINGSPLSYPDVAIGIAADARFIRSVSKDGYVSTLEAPPGGWKSLGAEDFEWAYKRAMSPEIVFGAMRANGQKELNNLLNDYWGKFAKEFNASYVFEKVYEPRKRPSSRPTTPPKIRFVVEE